MMKYLPTALILLTGVIATAVPTIAQELSPSPAVQTQPPVTPNTLLLTEPASVRRSGTLAQPRTSPFDPNDLDSVAGSMQVRPQRPQNPLPSIIPDEFMPKQAPQPAPINPIDYFQPPGPESGLRLTVPTD
ncbi:hypothetical protein [Pantanalinema rosaneae]|uniref:hypothetical protein n=1 Tax=Pantanalinema rosaneae TaxID=1620701 RepID=UPI003D6F276B